MRLQPSTTVVYTLISNEDTITANPTCAKRRAVTWHIFKAPGLSVWADSGPDPVGILFFIFILALGAARLLNLGCEWGFKRFW